MQKGEPGTLYACAAEDSRQRSRFHISAYILKLERISPSRVEAQSTIRMLGLRGVTVLAGSSSAAAAHASWPWPVKGPEESGGGEMEGRD